MSRPVLGGAEGEIPSAYSTNRYVWKSNLSEEVFTRVLFGWCESQKASLTAKWVSEWAESHGEKPISRETVSNYFNLIGSQLWAVIHSSFYRSSFFRSQPHPPESIEGRNFTIASICKLYDIVSQKQDLKELRKQREAVGMYWSVDADLVVSLLMQQYKFLNGFSLKWAHAYFARAFILSELYKEADRNYEDAIDHFVDYMLQFLEQYPLRKPLPAGKFLWSEGWDRGLDAFLEDSETIRKSSL